MNSNFASTGDSVVQEQEQEVEAKVAATPNVQKETRACLACGILQTQEQFFQRGCPNCEEFLRLKQNKAKIVESTSSNYSG